MLTALKIGLLAFLPLSISQNENSWTLTPTEAVSSLENTFNYLQENALTDKILLSYNSIDFTYKSSNDFTSNGYLDFIHANSNTNYLLRWYGSYITSEYIESIQPYGIGIIGEFDAYMPFEYDLIIKGNNSWNIANNDGLTQALEQDINSLSEDMPSISDIFGQVTNSITSFIGSLGQAFNSVTSLFYSNGSWTFLGVLILIGVGVGLVYGAYRLIKGLLHRV